MPVMPALLGQRQEEHWSLQTSSLAEKMPALGSGRVSVSKEQDMRCSHLTSMHMHRDLCSYTDALRSHRHTNIQIDIWKRKAVDTMQNLSWILLHLYCTLDLAWHGLSPKICVLNACPEPMMLLADLGTLKSSHSLTVLLKETVEFQSCFRFCPWGKGLQAQHPPTVMILCLTIGLKVMTHWPIDIHRQIDISNTES